MRLGEIKVQRFDIEDLQKIIALKTKEHCHYPLRNFEKLIPLRKFIPNCMFQNRVTFRHSWFWSQIKKILTM